MAAVGAGWVAAGREILSPAPCRVLSAHRAFRYTHWSLDLAGGVGQIIEMEVTIWGDVRLNPWSVS